MVNLGNNVNNSFSQSGTYVLNDSLLYFTSPTYKEKYQDGEFVYTDIYDQIFVSNIDEDFYTPAKPLEHDRINTKKWNYSNFFLDTITQTIYFNCTKKASGMDNSENFDSVARKKAM